MYCVKFLAMFTSMVTLDSKTKRLLNDPRKRRAWVIYQVSLTGRSLAQVAREHGVKKQTLYRAFDTPYPRMERVIAQELGLEPQQVFPERYDDRGLPNRGRHARSRAAKTANSSSRQDAGNDKASKAA